MQMLLHTYIQSTLLAFCVLALLAFSHFIIILKMLAGVPTIKENKKHCVYLSHVEFNMVAG